MKTTTTTTAATTLERGMAHLVISRPFLIVAQNFKGFTDFLKFILGGLVVRIFVWVKLHSLLAISLLDLIL